MTSYEEVVQRLQKEINCLSDSDPKVRKDRSLNAISKALLNGSPPMSKEDVEKYFVQVLQKPLFRVFADPREKCREISIDLVREILEVISDVAGCMPFLVEALKDRLGSPDMPEGTEEIRLQLVELLLFVVPLVKEDVVDHMEGIITTLRRTLQDPFPEIKQKSCSCIVEICKYAPARMELYASPVLEGLLKCAVHQRYNVRLSTVRALSAIIKIGNGALPFVAEIKTQLRMLAKDRMAKVRQPMLTEVIEWLRLSLDDAWLGTKGRECNVRKHLIPIALSGVTDEYPEVRESCFSLLEALGESYAVAFASDVDAYQKAHVCSADVANIVLPTGIKERPGVGIRTLVCTHAQDIVPPLLEDLKNWTAEARLYAGSTLCAVLAYVEDDVADYVDSILKAFYAAIHDDDPEVASVVDTCSRVIGSHVPLDRYHRGVLRQCLGRVPNTPPSFATNAMRVLSQLLLGAKRTWLQPETSPADDSEETDSCPLEDISEAMRLAALNVSDDNLAPARPLVKVLCSLITTGGPACESHSFLIFASLLRMSAISDAPELTKEAKSAILDLSRAISPVSDVTPEEAEKSLFCQFLGETLEDLAGRVNEWDKTSPELPLLSSVVNTSPEALPSHLDALVSILLKALDPSRDGDMRSKIWDTCILLFRHAKESFGPEPLMPYVERILRDGVISNATWKIGKPAARGRLACMKGFDALLSSGAVKNEHVSDAAFRGLVVPPLMSCLDDDYFAETRAEACKAATKLWPIMRTCFEDEEIFKLYPDLLKRLDDSQDYIRVLAAKMFNSFTVCCLPPGYSDTQVGYMAKTLLIHLDDTNNEIQEAVYDTLISLSKLQRDEVLQHVNTNRDKHRSTMYCDRLLREIQQ